jgi:hypothetical protein
VNDVVFEQGIFCFFEFCEISFCEAQVVFVFVVELHEIEQNDARVGELFDADVEVVVHVVQERRFLNRKVVFVFEELFQWTIFVDATFLVNRNCAFQQNLASQTFVFLVRIRLAHVVSVEKLFD